MPMFDNASEFIINGGSFYDYTSPSTALQYLRQSICIDAFHNSAERYPPPRCLPGTRVAVIGHILGWGASDDPSSKILWMRGAAGAGKSAIAQTIAEHYANDGQLGASFFSRSSNGRNDEKHLFPTIAYQLALSVPGFLDHLEKVLESDPSIIGKSLDIQLQRLIIEPLLFASAGELLQQPKIVAIDGLEECLNPEMQSLILRLLGSALLDEKLPIRVLITSRSEPWIRDEFNRPAMSSISEPLTLDESWDPELDIDTFLRAGFADICGSPKHQHTMRHLTSGQTWPSESILATLVQKASGQFIYASTVLKFVDDPYASPAAQLEKVVVAKTSSSSPLAALDRLYLEILRTNPNVASTKDVLRLLTVLITHTWIYAFAPGAWPVTPDLLYIIEKMLSLGTGEVYLALRDLHSLVYIPEQEENFYIGSKTKFLHGSFLEFLTDQSRSEEYFVDFPAVHSDLVVSSTKLIWKLKPEDARIRTPLVWIIIRSVQKNQHLWMYLLKGHRSMQLAAAVSFTAFLATIYLFSVKVWLAVYAFTGLIIYMVPGLYFLAHIFGLILEEIPVIYVLAKYQKALLLMMFFSGVLYYVVYPYPLVGLGLLGLWLLLKYSGYLTGYIVGYTMRCLAFYAFPIFDLVVTGMPIFYWLRRRLLSQTLAALFFGAFIIVIYNFLAFGMFFSALLFIAAELHMIDL